MIENNQEEILTAVNVVMDYHTYKAFKKIVGAQNASKEIRRMIKERVLAAQRLEEQKNEKPQENLKLFTARHTNTFNEVMIHA